MSTSRLKPEEIRVLRAIANDDLSDDVMAMARPMLERLASVGLVQTIERPDGSLIGACPTLQGRRWLATYLGPERQPRIG